MQKLFTFYFVFSGLLTWTTIVYFDRQITNLDELFEVETVDEESTDELVFTEYSDTYYNNLWRDKNTTLYDDQ